MAALENVLKPVVKVVRLKQRQYASAPSTHTGLLCQRRVKAPVPEKIQTLLQLCCLLQEEGLKHLSPV